MLKKGSVLQMHNHPQYERRGQRHHPGSVLSVCTVLMLVFKNQI